MTTETAINLPHVRGVLEGVDQELIDARTLYETLHVNRPFVRWMKERIAQAKLESGRDFIVVALGPADGARLGSYTYHLTFTAALKIVRLNRWNGHRSRSIDPRFEATRCGMMLFLERYPELSPENRRVYEGLGLKGMTDFERAALMGWDMARWEDAIGELESAGLLDAQLLADDVQDRTSAVAA